MINYKAEIAKELSKHRNVTVELGAEGFLCFTCECGYSPTSEHFGMTKTEWLAQHQTESLGKIISQIQHGAAQSALTSTAQYAIDYVGMWSGHSTLVDLQTETQYVDVATWLLSRAEVV